MIRTSMLPVALLFVAISGCGSPGTAASVPDSGTPASSSGTPTVSAPSPAAVLKIGNKATLADDAISVEVVKLETLKKSDRDAPAMSALIRMCNVSMKDPIGPSWDPWSLVTSDGEQYAAATETYTYDPKPQYPFIAGDRRLDEGDCAKGWVVFEVTKGAKVAAVEYDNESGDHLEWAVR